MSNGGKEVVIRPLVPEAPPSPLVRAEEEVLAATLHNIRLMERWVETALDYGPDWGREKGIDRDFLKEPGADKIFAAFNSYPRPVVVEKEVDAARNLCSYIIMAEVVHRGSGQVIATGTGVASTRESKWGKRWVWEREALSAGYQLEGLRTRKVSTAQGPSLKYQVPNEDWGDLMHTLFDMAYKRGKVEAAESLPGARTALSRMFNPDLQYAQFWRDMNAVGATGDDVHEILGVESVKEWVAAGRTLEEAKALVLEEVKRRRAGGGRKRAAAAQASPASQPPSAEAGQPPSPEEDPFAPDPRQVVRQQCVDLLTTGPAPTADQLTGWWEKKGWGYQLRAEDLQQGTLDPAVKLEHLTAFYTNLLAWQKMTRAQKATPAPKKGE